jgi:hypothetical protein
MQAGRYKGRDILMRRSITCAILGAAATGATIATFGLTAAGAAGAATGPVRAINTNHFAGNHTAPATGTALVVITRHLAGYHAASSETRRFRYAATTLRVKACPIPIARTKNPVAVMALFGGRNWDAEIDVLCNGGARSIFFFDQKSATTHASGAFRLSPRVGDRLRISISRNVSRHRDSFTVTNLRTGRSQTVRVTTSTAVFYRHAFVGSAISSNADVMPLPANNTLLWTFWSSRVVTNGGVRGTLRGPWAAVKYIDRTAGGVLVMYPGKLSAAGGGFSTYLHAAP